MKNQSFSSILLCLFLTPVATAHAQAPPAENKVTIVSCKTGNLYIDGNLIGPIEADDAKQEVLSYGEHYLQVKTSSEKLNLTTSIDQNSKNILRIGCNARSESTVGPASESQKAIVLIDKQLNLGRGLSHEMERSALALDAGDEILLTCTVLNKKGNANISITGYPDRNEIFKNEGFNSIDQQRIQIASKGIYVFTVTTKAIFGRDIKLNITRIPSPNSPANFNTHVKIYYDTTQQEVVNTTTVVHSISNNAGNRTIQKFQLPAGTKYWVYWIGVGQEARERMKTLASQVSKIASAIPMDPLFAYGMKLIPELPALNTPSNISFRFMDSQNGSLFMTGQPCQSYNCSYADNVSATYSLVTETHPDMVLTLMNNSSFMHQDVEIRIEAFVVKQRLELQE